MPRCSFCGREVELIYRKVGRQDTCPHCGRDLHACLQCRFYDRSFHNQCRESQAAMVGDKERSNFCEFFEFGRDAQAERAKQEESRKRLEGLFRK
ncbi:MAG: hypothetical protein JXA24_07075 [Proteobacteria bacterium]|nr:hypothetical protein [Pseudomonadota bacterium]